MKVGSLFFFSYGCTNVFRIILVPIFSQCVKRFVFALSVYALLTVYKKTIFGNACFIVSVYVLGEVIIVCQVCKYFLIASLLIPSVCNKLGYQTDIELKSFSTYLPRYVCMVPKCRHGGLPSSYRIYNPLPGYKRCLAASRLPASHYCHNSP